MTIITIDGTALSELIIIFWEALPFELLAFLIMIYSLASILGNLLKDKNWGHELTWFDNGIDIKFPLTKLTIFAMTLVLVVFGITNDYENFGSSMFGLIIVSPFGLLVDWIEREKDSHSKDSTSEVQP